jgi:hypothetical protein
MSEAKCKVMVGSVVHVADHPDCRSDFKQTDVVLIVMFIILYVIYSAVKEADVES